MKYYTFTEVMKIVDVRRERLRQWIDNGFIKPDIRKPIMKFTDMNLSGIFIFKMMLEAGISRKCAKKYIEGTMKRKGFVNITVNMNKVAEHIFPLL